MAREVVQDTLARLLEQPVEKRGGTDRRAAEGLAGKESATDDRRAANLAFLPDVSGSMNNAKKLPLVKDGLRKLVAALLMVDRIAIVVYAGASDELLTVKLRYKAFDAPKEQGTSRLLKVPVTDGGDAYADADADLQFAAAVAGFGMVLRSSDHVGGLDLDRVAELARAANARFAGTADEREARESLVKLVDRAAALTAGRE